MHGIQYVVYGILNISSFGDKIESGCYRIHSQFEQVINCHDNEKFVSFVTPEVGAGPDNIVVDKLPSSHLNSNVVISPDGLIKIGKYKTQIDKSKIYHSNFSICDIDIEIFLKNLGLLKSIILQLSHPKSLAFVLDKRREANFAGSFEREFVKQIDRGIKIILSGNILDGLVLIKGTGFGLTPSGDDFIAGFLLGLNVYQHIYNKSFKELIDEIYRASVGTNLLTNRFLTHARFGNMTQKFKNLINSLFCKNDSIILENARSVMEVGETSGADLLVAFVFVLNAKH